MTIFDGGANGSDHVYASGIGLSLETSYVATIEGRHLYGFDQNSQQGILVIDFKDAGNKIEKVTFSDGEYSYEQIVSFYPQSNNFLGDLSWSDINTIFSASEINSGLEFYKDWVSENSNSTPYFISSPITEISEKSSYSYFVVAVDDDANSSLSINITGLPNWLSFNVSTGELSGSPSQSDLGEYPLQIEVIDNKGARETQNFTLSVNNVNDAPEFTFTAPTSTDENAAFSFQLTAVDIDFDVVQETLTYEEASAPSWMSCVFKQVNHGHTSK